MLADPSDGLENVYANCLEHIVTREWIPVSTRIGTNLEGTMSSDGAFLVYREDRDLMIVPTDGSTDPLNYTRTRNVRESYPAWNPTWDPDGDGGF